MNCFAPLRAAFAIVAIGLAAQAAEPSVAFNTNGLSSLSAGGSELLVDSQLRLQQLTLDPGVRIEGNNFEPVSRRYSASNHTQEQVFRWGVISCAFQPFQNGLTLLVELRNTGSLPITAIHFDLMQLRFPVTPKGTAWKEHWTILQDNPEAPPAILAIWDGGGLALCNDDPLQDPVFGFRPNPQNGGYAIVIHRDHSPVKPGETAVYRLSIQTGGKDATPATLAGNVYAAFAKRYPFELNWPDRRPIATAFLSTSVAGYKTNPRGWLMDQTIDTTTAEGRAKFREKMLRCADLTIKNSTNLNAQGVIVWDIEGQEMPHAISYLGDPRVLPQAAPEMDAIADELFARFKKAGLRTGVTIRPTRPVLKSTQPNQWEQTTIADPLEEMNQKIAYARKRWGCTLFYVDSNVFFETRENGKISTRTMPASMFRELAKKNPDALLMPEHESPRHWAYTAPYNEYPQGYTSTPEEVRALYPKSFSVLRVVDGPPLEAHWAELVAAVKAGDVLLFRAWWNDPVTEQVKRIYQEASGSR